MSNSKIKNMFKGTKVVSMRTFDDQMAVYDELLNTLEYDYQIAQEKDEQDEVRDILHEIKGYTYFMDEMYRLNELIQLDEDTEEAQQGYIVRFNEYLKCDCSLSLLTDTYKRLKGKKEEVPMSKEETVVQQQKSDEWYAAMLHTRYIHYKHDAHKTSYKKGKDTVFVTIKHDGVTFDLCEKTAKGWKRLSRSVKPLGQALLLNIMNKSKTFKKYVIETENSK